MNPGMLKDERRIDGHEWCSGAVGRLEQQLVTNGFEGRLLVMLSSGGVAGVEEVRSRPVLTLRSGPVGGVMATADPSAGGPDAIAADMGGTSFDVGLVVDGAQ